MMKKIIQILLMCLIIAGIIVIATVGFNVGIKYSENTQININIGTEFKIEDIRNITDEVFNNKTVLIQQVELYKDMVQIIVEDATEEEISTLNEKINEKYNLENQISNIAVTNNSNVKLRNIIKPYILPVTVVSILTIAFAMIAYRKQGIWKVAYITAMSIVAPQAILSSLYAVTRLPINRLTSVIAIVVYIASITIPMIYFNKIKERINDEKLEKE